MSESEKGRYGPYERQRLLRILTDLHQSRRDLSWVKMAQAISDWRNIHFQRMCFYRLKEPEKHGELGDDNVEIIVSWIEENHDAAIRERLKPQAIFSEMGQASRDYYLHVSAENVIEEWDEQLLRRFAGVYLCAPENDLNSSLPMPVVREWIKNAAKEKRGDVRQRSIDLNHYIQKRSILILQYCEASHYYAAEFPLSLLLPQRLGLRDPMMVCEGIGVVSSNSIHVQMRDCLSRVPKTISIVIKPKPEAFYKQLHGLSLPITTNLKDLKAAWSELSSEELEHFRREFENSLESEMFLAGSAQYSVSPLSSMDSAIMWNTAEGQVYHPKPSDFLKKSALHLLYPEIGNEDIIEKIIDNPLSIGELL